MGLMLTPSGRVFDTRTGRFLSRDPIRLPGQNPYIALRNNPQNFVDPWGLAGKKTTQSLPEWPARLPLDAPRLKLAPSEFTPGLSFRIGGKDYKPKSLEELRAMWPRILLEAQEQERRKAQEALKTRTRVTYVNCSEAEQKNVAETLGKLQDKLRRVDPKKCPRPCCHLDFGALRDVLGKLEIKCAARIEHDVRPGGEAYGKQEGHPAYGITLQKQVALWKQRALAALSVHETLHTAMFQFEDPHRRYGKDPTAEEMAQCVINCISPRGRSR